MELLIDWLNEEMNKRGWSLRELARRADLSSGTLSLVLNEQRGAGPEFCTKVARALGVPPVEVFRRAGLLPPQMSEKEEQEALLYYFDQMTLEQKKLAVTIIKAMVQEEQERRRAAGTLRTAGAET